MSSIVYLKNKSNGKVYAYLNESIWDSENKKCKCKRKCLGHVDPVTGKIVPNGKGKVRESAIVSSVGATAFLEKVSDDIGLTTVIREAVPDHWELFMSCLFYVIAENGPLSNLVYWCRDNDIPYGKAVENKDIIDMLDDFDMNTQFRFFRGWRDNFHDNDFCTMYFSIRSSYDRNDETIRFNDLPLVHVEQRTNICVTFDMGSMVPVSYGIIKACPRSLTEIRNISREDSWLDYDKITRILDSSFFTENNFQDLLRSNERFLLRVPIESKLAMDSIDRVRDRIVDIQYSVEIGGESYFAMSFLNYFEGRKCYMHILFSPQDAEKEFSLFLELLDECKNELKNGIYVPEHNTFYNRYFIIHDQGSSRTIEENGENVMSYNTVAGYVVLVSNSVKSAKTAMEQFLIESRIKKNLENLRNEKDKARLKLYDDDIYKNRIFLQFCAMILYREINRRKSKYSMIRDMSFSDMMNEMKSYKRMSIPGFDTPFYTNINNTQSKIMNAFGMDAKNT